MADIFETCRAVFASANTVKDKGRFINGTKRRTVDIEIRMSRVGVARVKRNTGSVKVKIVAQHGIGIILIKRRVGEKSMVSAPKVRVSGKKIQKSGFERSGIGDFLVKIGVVGFM